MGKVSEEIKDHPIMSVFIGIISSAIITVGSTTFATMGYVDKKFNDSKKHVDEKYKTVQTNIDEKHSEIKEQLKSINTNIIIIQRNVLEIYKQGK